jgi:precorrin-6B methylase 2
MRSLVATHVLFGLFVVVAAPLGGADWVRAATAPSASQLDAPYVVTSYAIVDRMLAMAEVGPNDFLIDLGSGDGRIVIAAALNHGARGLGVDIDSARIAESRENAMRAGVEDKVSFRLEDLFETDIREASVVTMYLLSSVNLRLRPRLLEELRPGTRIVSHAYDLGEWQADNTDEVKGAQIYLWIVPAKVEGHWQLEGLDEEPIRLTFDQEYQKIDGAVRRGNSVIPLREARLDGDRIHFTFDNGEGAHRFSGRVAENVILPEDESENWRMMRVR